MKATSLFTHRNSRIGTDTSSSNDHNLPCFPNRICYILELVRRSGLDVESRHFELTGLFPNRALLVVCWRRARCGMYNLSTTLALEVKTSNQLHCVFLSRDSQAAGVVRFFVHLAHKSGLAPWCRVKTVRRSVIRWVVEHQCVQERPFDDCRGPFWRLRDALHLLCLSKLKKCVAEGSN